MNDNFHIEMNEYLPLRDVVFQTLRKAILKGQIKPGERLMEIQLAQQLGVSRTPVREAIRKLEQEELAIMIPRKGAIVAEITMQDLEDVLEVRAALEGLAVQKACDYMTEEQLEQLKLAAEAFKKSLREDDLLACVETDMAFHDVIYNAANNRRLLQILKNLREQMYRYRMEYLKDSRTHAVLIQEHDMICKAIKSRDKELAGNVMRTHIVNQKEFIGNNLRG